MNATKIPWSGPAPDASELEGILDDEGLDPHWWSNGTGDKYEWHSHPYHKVLYCGEGSITFHTRSGDFQLEAGDRLEIAPRTEHAATVGPHGCRCVEAARYV